MELEFRRRDYGATHESQFLPRSEALKHPLSSTLASRQQQVFLRAFTSYIIPTFGSLREKLGFEFNILLFVLLE